MNVWLRAMRVHFLPVVVAPVLVGTAASWGSTGRLDAVGFALALLGALLVQAAANMSNDHFDHLTETDARNARASAFSGGSRVIQEGLLTARAVLTASVVCLILAGAIGVFLAWRSRSLPLVVGGVLGLSLAWFYTAPPLRLGYHGLGEPVCGFCFGPLVVTGSALAQQGRLLSAAMLASVPVGLLVAGVLLVNEFPDRDADRSVGKRTLVVLAGEKTALVVWIVGMLAPFLWVPAWVVAGQLPVTALVCLAAAPLAGRALTRAVRNVRDGAWSVVANRMTVLTHLVFSTTLALGLALGRG